MIHLVGDEEYVELHKEDMNVYEIDEAEYDEDDVDDEDYDDDDDDDEAVLHYTE